LANLFLHYALDSWMAREFPAVAFERYADDAVYHCRSERQAQQLREAIAERLAGLGLVLHPIKTRVVYCKDSNRAGSYEHERFDFLGYTFRPRLARNRAGGYFVSFTPAVSDDAVKAMGLQMRRWRLHLWSGSTLSELAVAINAIVQGWINYYGRFYRSRLRPLLSRIDDYLVRWLRRKYRRFRHSAGKAWRALARIAAREPDLFAHWRYGLRLTAG
jgi:RNA-directed DNA polymerase